MTVATAEKRQREASTQSTHTQPYQGTSPIKINKLGHFVYEVSDIERTVKFWTEVMGFAESDRNRHGMVFLRCNGDHHGIGLRQIDASKRPSKGAGLQVEHLAFEVSNVEMLLKARDYLKANNIPIIFEGRKGPGCNISLNFLDPDGFEFEIYYGIDQVDGRGKFRPSSHYRRADSLEEAIANPVQENW
jgi:catechol 2,3-dioxygenase-like lactoylglutathione lyase family enzyme